MQRQQKLLLSFMVAAFVLVYGIAVATAITSQEIEIAKGSTVYLMFKDSKGNGWTGSGFVVYDGQIATNYHVIDNMSIGVAKLAGKEDTHRVEAILAVDKKCDLAIVKVTGIDAPALPLGDSNAVQEIDKVYVVGNPRGLEGTFSAGIISAIRPPGYLRSKRGGDIPCKMLQIDASMSTGSSGGPVLNDKGEVIGISKGGYGFLHPDLTVPQNLNFAIAVNHLKTLMPIPPTPVKPKPVEPKVVPPPVQPKPAKPQADTPSVEPEPVKPKVVPPPIQSKPTKPQADLPSTEPKPTLTTQEIAKITLGSTVHLGVVDANGKSWTGSGFVIRDDQIVTNYHVIDNMSIGGVKLVGKEDLYPIEATLAVEENRDLAIIKVVGIDVPALSLGDSDTVQIGDKVYVAGNPQGLEGSFSDGIISAIRGGSTDKFFQMTAPISQGSSGGPVVNEKGEVIGVSFATLHDGQNLNFAIPVNYLKPMVKMPIAHPIVKHDAPPKISVGEIIPLTLDLISSQAPQQVTIHYKTYDRNRNKLEQNNQKMLLSNQQSASSTWTYKMNLPSQNHVGSIEYYIEIEYDNHLPFRYPRDQNRHYQISIVDGRPPKISLLYPPPDATFGANQEVIFRAEVTDNTAVKDVHIHISSRFNDPQSYKLTAKGSSDIYTIPITFANIITLQYYLTATDEEGNEGKSKYRDLEIRITSQENLENGIRFYEQARYREAINALSSAIRELENPKQRAEACLYLGGSKRGIGEGNDKVREQFQESIRHNPDQELPPRLGKDHPIFAELIEEVRKELTGELTVISLLPETEIWIEGNKIDRKMLGTGIVSSRLLTGNYIVEAIYTEKSPRKTVTIESERHKVLDLGIPPTVEHDPPPKISVGERIPLALNLISTKSPQQVKIYYTIYDRDKDELEQNNQEMRLWGQQSTSSTWVYKVDLPAQDHVGSIEYYIEIEYESHLVFKYPSTESRYYQISVVDEKPPTIFVLYPPDGAKFKRDQKITIRAKVSASLSIKAVHVHFSSSGRQKMSQENSSDVYAARITVSQPLRYYLIATDEAGNTSESESRRIEIIKSNGKPTISVLYPSDDPAEFEVNEQITIEAEVKASVAIKAVHVHFSSGSSKKMSQENSPDIYTTNITFRQAESIKYYLTAIDEASNTSESESRQIEIKPPPPPPPEEPDPPIYEGIWASVSAGDIFTSDRDGNYMFRLAYLREGKNQSTLGAQLDLSLDRTNMSAMVQWGPRPPGKTKATFTLLGGIAAYEDSPGSTHTTPIFGGGVKLYPRDRIVIDATGSIQLQQGSDTLDLYHYEVGIRFYITSELSLRAGYGQLFLGDQNVPAIQVGLGYTF